MRIARLLGVDQEEVDGLAGLDDGTLRWLHDQISLTIFGRHHRQFGSVANLSKAMPGMLAGKLAERFVPPTLAARISEQLEPAKARELVSKVSVGYLADLTMALDPVRAKAVVQAIPPADVAKVAREMFRRGELAAMAELAGAVTLDGLFAAFDVATARDLLGIAPLIVWNDNIDRVVAEIPTAKICDLVREAARVVATGDDPHVVARLAPVAGSVRLDRIREVATALFAAGDYAAMATFAGVVPPEGLLAAVQSASAHDLLAIVPLVEWTDAFARVIADVPVTTIDALLREVADAGLWDAGCRLIDQLEPGVLDVALERARDLPEASFAAFRRAADAGLLSHTARDLVDRAALLRGSAS